MGEYISYKNKSGDESTWKISESNFKAENQGKFEAVFCQGNGYLGLRNSLEEDYIGSVRNLFVSGAYNRVEQGEVSELANMPDVIGMTIYINDKRLNLESGKVSDYRRILNLKTGEVSREFSWEYELGQIINFRSSRFVSQINEHLIANKVEITSNVDADIRIITGIDGSVSNSGAQHLCNLDKRIIEKKVMRLCAKTSESDVDIMIHSICSMNQESSVRPILKRREVTNQYESRLLTGKTYIIEKLSTIYTSRDWGRDELKEFTTQEVEAGLDEIIEISNIGYDSLRSQETVWWKQFWNEKDVVVESPNKFEQLAVRFAIYHLNAFTNKKDNRIGIGAKGLSGEGYKGHSFWDTELFIFPYFLYTNPEVARNLLEYRYLNLLSAKEKAKKLGYEGAAYPWESAWYTDGEECPETVGTDIDTGKPLVVLAGTKELHITADIVYAIWQYANVTGDLDFMEKCGNEIVVETAKYWVSRFEYNEQKDIYEITDIIGPDEYKQRINNNAYTNYMAIFNIKLALNILESMSKEEIERLKIKKNTFVDKANEVISKAYLPVANEAGIIEQFEGYKDLLHLDLQKYKNSNEVMSIYKDFGEEQLSKYKVSKQADLVMLIYLLEELFTKEEIRNNFTYYEGYTLHDSSLSACVHTILANDLELNELADKLYEKTLNIDLGTSMNSSSEGIHSAAIGGIYLATVCGYGGVRYVNGNLRIKPKLPTAWNRLKYKVSYKGVWLEVECTQESSTITNEGTSSVEIIVEGTSTEIRAGKTIEIVN